MPACRTCPYVGDNFYPYLLTKCKPCHYAYQKAYRQRQITCGGMNKDRKYQLKKRYGLSVEQYEALLVEHDGYCGACGELPGGYEDGRWNMLVVDHCHETGVVRGLLCNGCNRAAGLLNDDIEKIAGLLRYMTEKRLELTA